MAVLSNQPPKGMSDWLPAEFAVRKYIFDTWRKVCMQFGYQEYLTPVLESADIYRAKSGEDVGGKELMTMVDQGGRELAIRPEMTPSVTRMVSTIYESQAKPIRLFSIANFVRNEKPQKGRNREFWQLNADIFGSESKMADVEILQLAVEIMKAFGATRDNFIIFINHRSLIKLFIQEYLKVSEDKVSQAVRILDKFNKLSRDEFIQRLEQEVGAQVSNRDQFINYMLMDAKSLDEVNSIFKDRPELQEYSEMGKILDETGYGKYFQYNPALARGLDYYDGMVFEVFDKDYYLNIAGVNTPEAVSRSLFGGGRYNGLAGLFGGSSFPAVGFAPGDETTKLFLEKYNLIPDAKKLAAPVVYVPLLEDSLQLPQQKLMQKLRTEGNNVIAGLEVQKFGKALDYANRIQADFVALLGEDENAQGKYTWKNLVTGEQELRD